MAQAFQSSFRTNFHQPIRSEVVARNGMAATSHPQATLTAIDVLKSGGNAVDAAVAAAAVLAVVEPHMTGIGGDCFAIVATPDGQLNGLNGSGRAPQALSTDWLQSQGVMMLEDTSPHAVTVPGSIKAWEQLLSTHGTLDFAQVLQPAITAAEEGFAVAPRVATDWAHNVDKLSYHQGSSALYLKDGAAPVAGDVINQPALAATMRQIAAEGSDAFYKGVVAEEIIETLAALGGVMTTEDLAAIDTLNVSPVTTDYKGLTIAELPPNGQGVIALLILNMLEEFDLPNLDPLGAERFHLELEAGRLAYAVRDQFIADPASLPVSTDAVIDKTFAKQLAQNIDPTQRGTIASPLLPPHSDTIYLTVVDKDRTAVSFINSLYAGFGTGIATAHSGVLLQNRGACFRVEPGHPNTIEGGKRPLHTIIPAFGLQNGKPILPFGVMGGAYQAVGHAHLITNLIDYGMGLQGAIGAPRMFWAGPDQVLTAEETIPLSTVEALKAKGHAVEPPSDAIGGSQAILIDHDRGALVGASDPRKDGCALGY